MVVDSYLGAEPQSIVACETLTTTNKVVLAGETRGPNINKDELVCIDNGEESFIELHNAWGYENPGPIGFV